jgi:hypothetical protein
MNWTDVEFQVFPTGGWGTQEVDVFQLLQPSDDMRLRFVVTDGNEDSAVEGAIDEVHAWGMWVNCQDFTPGPALSPNPVGDTLFVAPSTGHALLSWQAPPTDGGHDAATLYRIERAESPAGPFVEAGSATSTQWYDIDALAAGSTYFYRVRAENAGGSE